MLAMPVLSLMLITTTQDFSSRLKEEAMDARQEAAVVFVNMGHAFERLGQGAKAGGVAVGHAARTFGQEVGEGAKKVGSNVKKRAKKLGTGVKEAFSPDPE
jgi:hypothetical protein